MKEGQIYLTILLVGLVVLLNVLEYLITLI